MEDLSQIAIGLCNGAVILVRGDILRDKNPKQKILRLESQSQDLVTGMREREERDLEREGKRDSFIKQDLGINNKGDHCSYLLLHLPMSYLI
jgi:hypothetical protein